MFCSHKAPLHAQETGKAACVVQCLGGSYSTSLFLSHSLPRLYYSMGLFCPTWRTLHFFFFSLLQFLLAWLLSLSRTSGLSLLWFDEIYWSQDCDWSVPGTISEFRVYILCWKFLNTGIFLCSALLCKLKLHRLKNWEKTVSNYVL